VRIIHRQLPLSSLHIYYTKFFTKSQIFIPLFFKAFFKKFVVVQVIWSLFTVLGSQITSQLIIGLVHQGAGSYSTGFGFSIIILLPVTVVVWLLPKQFIHDFYQGAITALHTGHFHPYSIFPIIYTSLK